MNLICGKLGTGIHCVKSIRIRVILGRIFQHLDWMPRDAFLSVFNLNVGKYGAQQLHMQTLHMLRKSMDWFLYDNILRHERVNLHSRLRNSATTWKKIFSLSLQVHKTKQNKNSLKIWRSWELFSWPFLQVEFFLSIKIKLYE